MTERPLNSTLKRRTRGAIYVEVLVAIIPVMIFFFGILQMAMLYSAKLIVRHSAWRAARSAVVILEDRPEAFEEQKRGLVYDPTASASQSDGGDQDIADSIGSVLGVRLPATGFGAPTNKAGPRLSAIQQAAYMSLAVLAPPPSVLMRSLGMSGNEFGDTGSGVRFLAGLFLYNRAAAMITLRDPEGGVADDVPSDGNVTVRVSYLYYCGMPIVNYIMCSPLLDLSGLGDAVQDLYRNVIDDPLSARTAASDFQADLQRASDTAGAMARELQYAEAPELLLPLMFSRAHFKMITAEVTLPNQGACYYADSSCYAADDKVVE